MREGRYLGNKSTLGQIWAILEKENLEYNLYYNNESWECSKIANIELGSFNRSMVHEPWECAVQGNTMIDTINTSGTGSKVQLEGLLREVRGKPRAKSATEARRGENFLEVGSIRHCRGLQKDHVKQRLINFWWIS